MHQLLHRLGAAPPSAPEADQLSARLVSIAGQDAYSPVWLRPFRRTQTGALPRRTSRRTAGAAVLALGLLLCALGGVGYATAPPLAAAVADPSDRARVEFAASLNQLALASRSVTAFNMGPRTALTRKPVRLRSTSVLTGPSRELSSAVALTVLHTAVASLEQVRYLGRQSVAMADGDHTLAGTLQISFQPGQGSAVRLLPADGSSVPGSGNGVFEAFLTATASPAEVETEVLAQLRSTYALSGWTGAEVAGRRATVVQAARPSATGAERVAARWWVDDATGLLLWQETYDSSGKVALAAGFGEVQVGGPTSFLDHLPPRLAVATATAQLTLSTAPDLSRRGWYCQGRLAGLSLVRLQTDRTSDPGLLHLVYGDGVSTVSVIEQPGRLVAAPSGSQWDAALRAYVQNGTPTLATWQSGDTVLTVVTDGSSTLLAEAVGAMPHRAEIHRTTMEQVRTGWVGIFELMSG